MTRTEELLALAEAATTNQESFNKAYEVMNAFDAAANPETIKQLVELVRLQHEALKAETRYQRKNAKDVVAWVDDAIAAFNKFEGGE